VIRRKLAAYATFAIKNYNKKTELLHLAVLQLGSKFRACSPRVTKDEQQQSFNHLSSVSLLDFVANGSRCCYWSNWSWWNNGAGADRTSIQSGSARAAT